MEQKLELIIQQLEEHKVPGREEFIKQLRDDEVKKDKKKLRSVLGKILTRTAEVGTIASAIASLLWFCLGIITGFDFLSYKIL